MIKVKINGIDVELERPMNVVDAARTVGIHVPHFCYHPELTIHAGCRICMVEVVGKSWLIAGCTIMMNDGMEVVTESEKITKSRRGVLELQLLHHPLDCPECDKGGECRLQDYAFKYGADRTRFIENKRTVPVNYNNPLLERNMERCVGCKRCVRMCAEMQGDAVLSDMERGSRVIYSSFMGKEEECVHCGHCMSNCPVGAIQSRLTKHSFRPWYVERSTDTICSYCANGCSLTLESRGGKILRALNDENFVTGSNKGRLCVKGRFEYDLPGSPERLTSPLIKRDGHFVEASWDEAVAFAAEGLKKIKAASGPDAIAGLVGGRTTNEENYLFQRFMRAAAGTNNIDNTARMGHINAIRALGDVFGVPGATGVISDLADAKLILQIGTDTATENPITGLFIKKSIIKRGGRLIVADAARNAMDKHAVSRLACKPGTLGILVRGLINRIFTEGLADKDTEAANAELFGKIKESVSGDTPDAVAERTGVDAASIRAAADEFAKAETAAIVFGRGITASHRGYENSVAVCYLSLITGNTGRPGTGVYPMAAKANEQGACDMGVLPDMLPGYEGVADDAARKAYAKAWEVKSLPETPGLTAGEMVQAAEAGTLKALYVMGANPAFDMPGGETTRAALGKLDLLIVQDIFMGETAKLADVVLPVMSSYEKDGTYTNQERRVQKLNRAVDAPAGTKTDAEAVSMISEKMGHKMPHGPADAMAEMSCLVAGYKGIGHSMLGTDGIHWPFDAENTAGTPVLYADGVKPNFVEFVNKDQAGAACEVTDGDAYPLMADIAVSLYHSGTTTRRTKAANMIVPEAYASMCPDEADSMGLKDGDAVVVSSRHGSLELKLKTDRLVPRGTIHIPNHFEGSGCSEITGLHLDKAHKVPVSRFMPVNVKGA